MGPGHFAVGFAAKPLAPKVPLWVLLGASEAIDILCTALAAAGIERTSEMTMDFQNGVIVQVPGSVPWSHGLFMAVVWSVLLGGIAWQVYRERRAGMVVGLVVISHWLLDFIVHSPDLPLLFDGSPTTGLGLWLSGPGFTLSMILEFVLLGIGVAIYLNYRRTHKTAPPMHPQAA